MAALPELARPNPDGPTLLQRFPTIRTVPDHLKRRTLMAQREAAGGILPEALWSERGRAVEEYTQDVLSTQIGVVESVELDDKWDAEGPDLKVKLVESLPIGEVCVEVKSSTLEIKLYKKKIRDRLAAEGINMSAEEWLIQNNIILINGGEKDNKEKTPEEILYDSFYPQLLIIIAQTQELRGQLGASFGEYHSRLAISEEPIEIFPLPPAA